ncbi:hypothetical protein [Rhodococcus sp. IEGM 1379]|uniref:hypothetical protein n=1 Tax=Rhodococcus sp. IEGM 1379 TaxID=3047086 RepID=UPI0024B77BBC|nr:hypothetical protein [Rhodococcus sp. IEGM 1379]MDI9914398.1 hypothetical protein [Rhodococcus sp. IEGM 1379]
MDAEELAGNLVENLEELDGFGEWTEVNYDRFNGANARGWATAYFEITSANGRDASMTYLVAYPVLDLPDDGAVDRAYDAVKDTQIGVTL